jgi:adenosylhomocysteine nucleosidase
MRIRSATLPICFLAALATACVSASSTTVQVEEPQPVGGAQRSSYQDGDARRVVVISAVPAELERLLAVATIERTMEIAGRVHHVGRLEGHPVVMFLSGVSMVNAAASTQAVIDHFDVGGIVFSGIAGGVNPNLAVGDVAVPSQWGQHQEMVFARATEAGWETDGRAGS